MLYVVVLLHIIKKLTYIFYVCYLLYKMLYVVVLCCCCCVVACLLLFHVCYIKNNFVSNPNENYFNPLTSKLFAK